MLRELIKKYNINPCVITTIGHGRDPQIFQINNQNRVPTEKATATWKKPAPE